MSELEQLTLPMKTEEGDSGLQEIWRVKDQLSAAHGHSIKRLFQGLRDREKKSGHSLINPPPHGAKATP